MGFIFPIALFGLIFYFLIFRPQKKKQQQHEAMISSIGRGDTVVTAGGFFGRVSDVMEDSYIIEIADGVKVRILKSSISIRRDAGDAKPRPQRPKKRKRPRPVDGTGAAEGTDAAAMESAEDAAAVPEENAAEAMDVGVTPEENAALIESAPDETKRED